MFIHEFENSQTNEWRQEKSEFSEPSRVNKNLHSESGLSEYIK